MLLDFDPLQVLQGVLIICAGVHAAEVVKMDDSSDARMLVREDEQLHKDYPRQQRGHVMTLAKKALEESHTGSQQLYMKAAALIRMACLEPTKKKKSVLKSCSST